MASQSPAWREGAPAPEAGAKLAERFTAEYPHIPVEVVAEQVKRAQVALQLFDEDVTGNETLEKVIRNNLDSMNSALDTGAQVAPEQLSDDEDPAGSGA